MSHIKPPTMEPMDLVQTALGTLTRDLDHARRAYADLKNDLGYMTRNYDELYRIYTNLTKSHSELLEAMDLKDRELVTAHETIDRMASEIAELRLLFLGVDTVEVVEGVPLGDETPTEIQTQIYGTKTT
jgi:predicted nuclease with TOPRIM domain